MEINSTYETDFYKWANEQAELLRSRRWAEADIENIAEEIESMGRSEKRELISRLEVLLMHLLKWEYQPSRQSKSWQYTIEEQRIRIVNHLEDNPSLKSKLNEIMLKAYKLARIEAAKETGLTRETFPENCPYTFEEAMGVVVN